jgi:hypothetical protein
LDFPFLPRRKILAKGIHSVFLTQKAARLNRGAPTAWSFGWLSWLRKGGGRATALQRFLADYLGGLLRNLPLCWEAQNGDPSR